MIAKIYDFVNDKNENEISEWLKKLPTKQRSIVAAKLELLKRYGQETLPGFVTPAVGSRSVQEIGINGERAIRLLFCRGPFETRQHGSKIKQHRPSVGASPEFTLLFGAEERDRKYVPRNAVQQAERRRELVIANNERRVEHVFIGPEDN